MQTHEPKFHTVFTSCITLYLRWTLRATLKKKGKKVHNGTTLTSSMSLFPSLKDPKRDTTAAKEAAGARSEGIVTSPRQASAVKYSCTKKNKYNPARKHFKSAQKNIMSFPSSHFLTLFWFTFSGRSPLFLLLLHDELCGQCFLAWRRILKGAARRPPHFQIVTLEVCLTEKHDGLWENKPASAEGEEHTSRPLCHLTSTTIQIALLHLHPLLTR